MTLVDQFVREVEDSYVGGHADDELLLPPRWAQACVAVLPVDGASLSLRDNLMRMPMGASDQQAAEAEMLQFTQGDGPCIAVYQSEQPVRASAAEMQERWPIFYSGLISRTSYRTAGSVPLRAANLMIGALDLYSRQDGGIASSVLDDAMDIARHIVQAMSTTARTSIRGESVDESKTASAWLHNPAARRRSQGWIAIGMLRATNSLSPAEALDIIRGYAWSHDLALDAVTEHLVSRTLTVAQLLQR